MNPALRKESLIIIARSRDAAPGALNFIEVTGRWPRRVLGSPPDETEMEAVELDARKLQRQLAFRTVRKRAQRSGVTVHGVTIVPADLPNLLLSTLAGRQTVMWRDRKAGYVEIDPQAVLDAVLAERESQYDAEAAKWAAIESAATADDLPPLPDPPKRKAPAERTTRPVEPIVD